MSGFDEGSVTFSNQNLSHDLRENTNSEVQSRLFHFIRNFKDPHDQFIYRDALRNNYDIGQYSLDVSLNDLAGFAEDLAGMIKENPVRFLPLFEHAAKQAYADLTNEPAHLHDIHITLHEDSRPKELRDLSAYDISRLTKVSGICIAATRIRAKATTLSLQCRGCSSQREVAVNPGMGGAAIPRYCPTVPQEGNEKCPPNPYIVLGDRSQFVDQQTLKLQEAPEHVPTGEMPRHILVVADRSLAGTIVPGTRISVVGVYSIFQNSRDRNSNSAVRVPYIHAMGIQRNQELGSGRATFTFTQEEEAQFSDMPRQTNIYETIARSIAPSIYGHEDIKKAIACLLLGGSRKTLPDGLRLRGDINVLLLGDPGTAKSQLLKFAEKVAPIAVYTSGKGSSAAGLTASVVRDPGTREFYLEGGAMVIGDGGMVCIDEFDKMNEDDRVAIHEAMEQQTISIAKAGITTVLNSRTSVLAAANPVFGRYDDMRSATDNIDFQTTILSRFDTIFIVRDERTEERDMAIAKHVIHLHMAETAEAEAKEGQNDIAQLKKYIAFCRTRFAPRLNEKAAQALKNFYVSVRSGQRQREQATEERTPIPITVRQLEALVRISESLAKMEQLEFVDESHVKEAIRLFKNSTIDAAQTGIIGAVEGLNDLQRKEVEQVETLIKQRLSINQRVRSENFVDSLKTVSRKAEQTVRWAIHGMVARGELEFLNRRQVLARRK